tara:strand:+ start:7505 stop:17986 length:10482 start_codon:yes stop_codon:yes gene_type:complete
MTSGSQDMQQGSGTRRSRKLYWLSGSSLAAAAFLMVSAPQAAQAQLRAPGLIQDNAPHRNNADIPRPDLAQNQPHNRAPGLLARDIRISAPVTPLPVNDIRISSPAPANLSNTSISSPASLPAAFQPHQTLADVSVSDVRISAPAGLDLDNIRISSSALMPGANQPQAPAGLVAINQPQAIGARISNTQAFQANGVSASAVTTVSRAADADVVTVFGAETFINWAPLDTANNDNLINILPGGTSLTFVGPVAGYTILNRILPTGTTVSGDPRGIAFSGNVSSHLGANDGPTGGNIWFYSPGGIVIGAGSTFDVGGLVLTTNDIDTTGGLFGAGGEIRFRGVADSLSSVTIENGATINASNNGSSYVAMVAPRVVQGGTVSVNGSAAYVAAEQADLTINNGLFDIAIGVGTTDANGVVHSGTTTGPSSTPIFDAFGNTTNADAQAIYMVAVPKNDALTMLVGGALGYQAAASAAVVNGNVVLSAGANVAATGNVTNASFAFDKTAADSDSNIELQNVAFGSSVSTFATNGIIASTTSQTDSVIASNTLGTQNILLEARNRIDINARGGGVIRSAGNLTLRAGTDGIGGTINIDADQTGVVGPIVSGLIADGNLLVDASAAGLDDFSNVRNNGGTGIGQNAVGGTINIDINGGGDLVVGGTARFMADAQGGKGETQNGSAQAGNINLDISSGTFNVTGTTFFGTRAIAAQNLKALGNGPGLVGSDSVGGNVNMALSGGVVTTGNMFVDLGAVATAGESAGGVQSNDATSGAFDLTVTGGSHVINDLSVNALADASTGSFDAAGTGISGFARSGGANFLIGGGSLTINSDLTTGFSTYGISPASAADRVSVTSRNGGSLTVTGTLGINTIALDGVDTAISNSGSIAILVDNAALTTGGLNLNSSARPNNRFSFFSSDEGRDFQAGDISLIAQNGGTFASGFSSFSANATGNDTNGGNGTGGDIFIHANNGSMNFTNSVFIDASGVGGVGGNSGNPSSLGTGQGGAINLRAEGASGVLSFTNLDINADGSIASDGEGGAPAFEGDGGLGFGGAVTFDILGGTFTANDIAVGSDGSGGRGGNLVTLPAPGLAPLSASQALPADLTVVNSPQAGGVSAGDGGDGQGGDVTFNLNGGNATVTNLTISANGFGGDGAYGDINNGTAGGNGGRGLGGSTTFNALSGTLTVTSTLTVSADGNNQSIAPYGSSGRGGFGNGSDGGSGGAGTGGTATFNLDGTATINAGQVVVSTNASGGRGGSSSYSFDALSNPIQAGISGNGGDATGGNATFNNNAGTLNFGQLSVTSTGTGGNGGEVFGISTGYADNIAGNGGSGTGGNATININQDDLGNPVYVVDASGAGGDGGDGLDGGSGGAAFGGIAAININGATAILDDPTIRANATGGNGGQGKFDDATFTTGRSGDGGNATGGTARLEVTGAGGNIDLGFISLQSDGIGGQGGAGSYNFSGDGGDGGSGGDAAGGRSELVTRTGGTINLTAGTFDFTSTGTGGAGGSGGNTYADAAGDGGDGGSGTGGTSLFLAQGGTITGQDVNFTVAGNGGNGGTGGTYGISGTNGVSGIGGTGSGGTAAIEVQEGSPGVITVANVTMFANGYNAGDLAGLPTGLGGRIEITDTSTDPAGLINLASLNVQALNAGGAPTGGFFVTGNSDAIAIAGNLTVNVAGNIEYDFDGDGQMTVGGNATLNSGQQILINHSNNLAPVNSIDVAGTFAATAQGNFVSTAGSRIGAGGTATVRSEQNATVADIAGVGLVDVSALQNVLLVNGAVTGTPVVVNFGAGPVVTGPQLIVRAGLDPTGTPAPTPTASYDPNFNATISGTVTSTGNIAVNAGGNAIFATGSSTISDNGLTVQTGDDIIIQTGASLTAANNPAATPSAATPFTDLNNLVLAAGALTPLGSAPLTPISSIVAQGDLDANGFAVVLSANAIDGLGGTITASSLSADINDAPSNAVIAATGQSDDNGLLSAQCVEGNICLGTINADNLVYIGQASNNDVIQGIVESGTISTSDILVSTRRDIIMGTDGIATVLDATNQFLVQSTEGNVDLRNASASSASVQVSAINGSLLGSGSLTSTNDIGITVGGDVNAASINTDGQLTTIALVGGGLESSYSVPGSISVNSLTQAGAVNVNIIAGGNINFGRINLPTNRSITLTAANGDAFLGSNSSATAISMLGNNVGFNTLLSTGNITLNATTGNLTGSGPGDLSANGAIDLDAGNDISFGNGTSPTGFSANAGGAINFGNITGRDIQFAAAGNITGLSALSPTSTGGVFDRVVLNAGANVTITAAVQAIDVVDIDGINVSLGSVNSNAANVLATGVVNIGSLLGGTQIIQGAAVTLGTVNINSANTATVTATAGNITAGNLAGGSAILNAAGNATVTDVSLTGLLDIDATGSIGFANVTARDIQLTAGGNIAGATAISPNTTGGVFDRVVLNAGGDVTVTGTVQAIDIVDVDGGNVTIGTLDSNDGDILATGAVSVGNITGTTHVIQGGSINLTSVAITGSLTANATTGSITSGNIGASTTNLDAVDAIALADVTVTGALFADAGGAVSFGTLTGRDIQINAGGTIAGTSAISSNATGGVFDRVVLNSGSNIDIAGSVQAVDVVDIDGANVTLGSVNSNAGNVLATGSADVGSLLGGTHVIQGTSVILDSSNIAGNLTVTATAGNISGVAGLLVGGTIDYDATGSIGFGSATASVINMASGGNIAGGDLTAANALDLNGGNIAIGDASAASIAMTSGLNILFNSLTSPNTITLTAASGTIGMNSGAGDIGSGGSVDLTAQALNLGDVTSSGSVNATATAGDAGFGTVDAANDIVISATGTPTLDKAISGGNTSITGASVTLNNGTIGGDLALDATAGDINGTGTVTVGGGIDLDATGNVGFGSLDAQGGTFTVDAGGNINFTSAASSDDMTLNAGGALVADSVSAAKTGSGSVFISAANGIDLRNVSGNSITLQAFNGLVNVRNNVDVTEILVAEGASVSIVTQQDMAVISVASSGDIRLSSAGNLDVQGAEATGDITINAGGSATISDTFVAGQSAPINLTGPQSAVSTGGDISITAADNVLIKSLLNAQNDLQITAGGLIDIQANVVGNAIMTTSSDMNIGSAGSLGQTDLTSDIQIFSDGTTQMVLGGATDQTGVFSLDNDEFSRIHSGGDLTLTALSTGIGGFDMVLQDLNVLVANNVSGPQSANIGLGNNLNFVSGQSIAVTGFVDFGNANANSGLNFTAGQDMFVDAASGIIQMTDANGSFSGSGSLSINAASIFAMTSQALDDIAGLSAADIDNRLASNDGIDLPDGLIRADNVQIAVTDNLLIQNTANGTEFADRRGFNAGSLSIVGPSTGNTTIVINGIVSTATGLDTIPATNVSIGFDPASTINGCVINNPASCNPTPTPTPTPVPETPEIDDPVKDVIEEEVTPERYEADPFASNPIEIKENEQLAEDPLIDEPVTGAGNDDLWTSGSDCERDNAGNCQPDDEEEEKEKEPAE